MLPELYLALVLLSENPDASQIDFNEAVCMWMASNGVTDPAWVYVQLYGASGVTDPGKPLPVPANPPPPRVQGWWDWLLQNWNPLWVVND